MALVKSFNPNKFISVKVSDLVMVKCHDCKETIKIEDAEVGFQKFWENNLIFLCNKCSTTEK